MVLDRTLAQHLRSRRFLAWAVLLALLAAALAFVPLFGSLGFEFAFVIGRRAKNVAAADALDFVYGYTLLHDVSARAIQLDWTSRTQDSQITLGKNPDGFSPIGPAIVTKDEIADPGNVRVATYVNGVQKQDASTADWIFPIPVLMEFLTRVVTLEPGDVVSTGTPSGIGYFRDPPEFLQPGDEVTIEADGIGRLTNPVVAGW